MVAYTIDVILYMVVTHALTNLFSYPSYISIYIVCHQAEPYIDRAIDSSRRRAQRLYGLELDAMLCLGSQAIQLDRPSSDRDIPSPIGLSVSLYSYIYSIALGQRVRTSPPRPPQIVYSKYGSQFVMSNCLAKVVCSTSQQAVGSACQGQGSIFMVGFALFHGVSSPGQALINDFPNYLGKAASHLVIQNLIQGRPVSPWSLS